MRESHLLFILGTRPEAIKLAPVIAAAKANSKVKVTVCSTGQHREMIRPILNFFQIIPDFELDMMVPNQSLTDLSAGLLKKLGDLIRDLQLAGRAPDWIVVQGDTTTAMIAALTAFYSKIKIAHVEAGLRTASIHSPWPEELNRRTIGLMADLHFAPSKESVQNLHSENKPSSTVICTGNTGIDALKSVGEILDHNEIYQSNFASKFSFLNPLRKMILVTVHRRENFGSPMENILNAVLKISQRNDVDVVIPVHLNPQVRQMVEKVLGKDSVWHNSNNIDKSHRIWLCDPLEYLDFVYMMKKCFFIISDSGGVQEEAPCLGKPVLVVRESTERPEAITAGANILVGTKEANILQAAQMLLSDTSEYQKHAQKRDVYGDGDGNASEKILRCILSTSEKLFGSTQC